MNLSFRNMSGLTIMTLFVFSLSFSAVSQVRKSSGTPARTGTQNRSGAQTRPASGKVNNAGGSQRASTVRKNDSAPKSSAGRKPEASGKSVGSGRNSNNSDRNISDRNQKTGDRDIKNSGNRVNIDNSRGDVNVNIDNSRNTVVRQNNYRPYSRPPYVYGGRRYYSYHPYYYHPYRPFYWGPSWHPWGFFVATLAATAIIVSVNNQKYHYDNGVYYAPSGSGYTVIQAPVGATVTTIPTTSQTVVINETTNNYYYGGAYYEKSDKGYTVVPPTAGAIVESLPEGGEEVKIGDQTYVKVGETYYLPIQKDGKDVYEVAQVEEEK